MSQDNHQYEFEKIISTMSSRFIGATNAHEPIRASLADIAKLKRASCAYVYLLKDNGNLLYMAYDWCDENVAAGITKVQEIHISDLPWWIDQLRNRQVIAISDVSTMPDEAERERKLLADIGVRSVLALPLFSRGGLCGFISFVNILGNGEWNEGDLSVLNIFAEILGNEIDRFQTEQELRESKVALQKSEAQFRAIFDCAAIGLALVDETGKIIDSNPVLQKMLGYSGDELRGKKFRELSYPLDRDADLQMYQELTAGERSVYQMEKRYVCRDGNVVWGRLTVSLIHGSPNQSPLTVRMVEPLKQPQSMLIHWEKMASIGQLAAGVAHEINNPLAYVHSNLNTLQEYVRDIKQYLEKVRDAKTILKASSDDDIRRVLVELDRLEDKIDLAYVLDDVGQLVQESIEGSERVKRIVQDLKTFSYADDGVFQLSDLNSIIQSALNIVWNQLKYHCTVSSSYGDLPMLMCNPTQLVQVLVNILVNAGQAIPKDRRGAIAVKSYARNGAVFVEITDNGAGIPQRALKRIFDPFYTTKPAGEGTGLGLSISHNIIQKHEGRIDVRSEIGVGTTFTVELPVKKAA
ncbi:MAG: ATP-binding protein [Chloroflexota bacterium]|jgi:PAS domain S-box-containing protein